MVGACISLAASPAPKDRRSDFPAATVGGRCNAPASPSDCARRRRGTCFLSAVPPQATKPATWRRWRGVEKAQCVVPRVYGSGRGDDDRNAKRLAAHLPVGLPRVHTTSCTCLEVRVCRAAPPTLVTCGTAHPRCFRRAGRSLRARWLLRIRVTRNRLPRLKSWWSISTHG